MELPPRRQIDGRPLLGRLLSDPTPQREISTRACDKAGPLLETARVTPENLLHASDDPYLLLIHGYANSREDAHAGYCKLTARLTADWRARVVHVFWPGDGIEREGDYTAVPWLYPITKKLSYSWQPERATESARLIAKAIAAAIRHRRDIRKHEGRPGRALAIHVVAHSLGCRLTLQMLRDLDALLDASDVELEIRMAVLMAGAVPLTLLHDRGPLAAALDVPRRVVIYHSKRDRALGSVFRLGQVYESIRPFLPFTRSRQALGRRGIAEVLGRREVYHTGIGHGDYWPSQDISIDIAALLDAWPGHSDRRLIQSRFSSLAHSPKRRSIYLV